MPTPKIIVSIHMSEAEHREIRTAAQNDGRTFTNFVRTAALRAARGLSGVPINPPSGLPSAADLDKYAEEQKVRERIDSEFKEKAASDYLRQHWGY